MDAAAPDAIAPLRRFVVALTALVERTRDEAALLPEARALLSALVADGDWLPDAFAVADAGAYRQYLLHCDPFERFSVLSFAWGPGQRTPIHDHTVWGLVGVLRGAERCREYVRDGDRVVPAGREHVLARGTVEAVSPTLGDWHVVSNALADDVSVSIHVYGGNIGALSRHRVDPATGAIVGFVSGYALPVVPNLWSRAGAAPGSTQRSPR